MVGARLLKEPRPERHEGVRDRLRPCPCAGQMAHSAVAYPSKITPLPRRPLSDTPYGALPVYRNRCWPCFRGHDRRRMVLGNVVGQVRRRFATCVVFVRGSVVRCARGAAKWPIRSFRLQRSWHYNGEARGPGGNCRHMQWRLVGRSMCHTETRTWFGCRGWLRPGEVRLR